ncbi:MAG: ribosome-associated translation inhibitor RaiA [Parvibaculaceae bacterium]
MQILTTGKNLDIGEALRSHVETRLGGDVGKYFDGTVRAQVIIEKHKTGFRTECSLHLTTGLTLQSRGDAPEAFASMDMAAEHLEKRLRRYKRRLRNHHAMRREPAVAAASFVISLPEGEEEEDESADLSPAVVAESTADIANLSVGEAVMQLDISNTPFVLFRNARHGGLNVVYRRGDGLIGWVDPEDTTARR